MMLFYAKDELEEIENFISANITTFMAKWLIK